VVNNLEGAIAEIWETEEDGIMKWCENPEGGNISFRYNYLIFFLRTEPLLKKAPII
jgi:hypothetical protein